ncbi:Glutathione S transferase D2 [Carabus blaptoides fortunei]
MSIFVTIDNVIRSSFGLWFTVAGLSLALADISADAPPSNGIAGMTTHSQTPAQSQPTYPGQPQDNVANYMGAYAPGQAAASYGGYEAGYGLQNPSLYDYMIASNYPNVKSETTPDPVFVMSSVMPTFKQVLGVLLKALTKLGFMVFAGMGILIVGVLFTTAVCSLTPFCTITFLNGYGVTQDAVSDIQVSRKAKLGQCIETVGIIPSATDLKNQKMSQAMDLYYLPVSPPCRLVMLVGRAVGVNFNLKTVNIMEGEHMTPEFLKMNPEHTIPTLNDNGLIIWESRPITTYLIDTYAKNPEIQALYPKDTKERVVVDQRLYFDACTLYAKLVDYFSPILKGVEKCFDDIKRMRFDQALGVLDKLLESHSYVAGDKLTVADFSIMVTVGTAEVLNIDITKHSNVSAWFEKCKKETEKYGYDEVERVGLNMFGQFIKSKLN